MSSIRILIHQDFQHLNILTFQNPTYQSSQCSRECRHRQSLQDCKEHRDFKLKSISGIACELNGALWIAHSSEPSVRLCNVEAMPLSNPL